MLRTKIVCTIGPSTASQEAISELVRRGMDVARINMSHGQHETHARSIAHVREAAEAHGRPVAVLVDLQGPKIRVGSLEEPVALMAGQEVVFAPEGEADPERELPTTFPGLAGDVSPGDAMLLDDGLLELECLGVDGDRARFEVIRGGILHSHKGMNLPGIPVSAPSLTEKDLADLAFALEQGADWIGLSFVRRAEDVRDLKTRVGRRALVVAKIEKAQAVEGILGILQESDAVMVARGDLGVELPFEQVPLAQKRIIQLANLHGRPVITATQMLESMIDHPRPTRAEASDVANALLDGTDAVMLSGETAVGAYPLRALDAMVQIAGELEGSGVLQRGPRYLVPPEQALRGGASSREHAVASSTVAAARQLDAPAIITITRSGFSARLVSSYRPPMPIFAVCTDPAVRRQLSGVWGVCAVLAEGVEVSYDALTEFGEEAVVASGIGESGQSVVVTAGFPFNTAGSTNVMRIEQIP
jgi:pyruvate kinase